jgi:hypothetical protein
MPDAGEEFDLTDLTDQVGRLKRNLKEADRLNGKLMRLMKNVLVAWHDSTRPELLETAMAELEEAFNDAEQHGPAEAAP